MSWKLILAALIIFIISYVSAEDPVTEIELTSDTQSYFISNKISLNLKIVPNGEFDISNIEMKENDFVEPDSVNIQQKSLKISEPTTIPINLRLKENVVGGDFRVTFVVKPEIKGIRKNLWKYTNNLFRDEISVKSNKFEVRYPNIELESKLVSSKQKTEHVYGLDLSNHEDVSLNCSVQIKLGKILTVTHKDFHPDARSQLDSDYDYFKGKLLEIPRKQNRGFNEVTITPEVKSTSGETSIFFQTYCLIDDTSVLIPEPVRQTFIT